MSLFKSLLFAGCGALVLNSCGENDPEEPIPSIGFVTVEVEAGALTAGNDEWIFASDKNGNLLAAQQLTSGTSFTLEGPILSGESFTIHRLNVFPTANNVQAFNVNSFTGVKFGSTWHINASVGGNSNPNNASASVTIQNFGASVSEFPLTYCISSAGGPVGMSASQSGSTAFIDFDLDESTDYLVSAIYGSTWHYELLRDVVASSSREITLRPMDNQLVIHLPSGNRGYFLLSSYNSEDNTNEEGYINSRVDVQTPTPSVSIGYVDGFTKYRSYISYGKAKLGFTYEKLGSQLSEEPTFADPTLITTAKSIRHAAAAISEPYHIAQLNFSHNTSSLQLGWIVFLGGDGRTRNLNFSINNLPAEITGKYPLFSLDGVEINSVKITQHLDDFRYEDFLDYCSNPTNTSPYKSDEYFSYSIQL